MKTYQSIKEIIEKFNYTIPFVGADDESDNDITISEGYEDTVILYEPKKLHYYQVTYTQTNKIEKYYENGMKSTDYL